VGIEDYVLSVAHSFSATQRHLKDIAQPRQACELPRLDFELHLSTKSADEISGTSTDSHEKLLQLHPPGRTTIPGAAPIEANSIIKGSLVTISADGGRPGPTANVKLRRLSSHRLQFLVSVNNRVGQPFDGHAVEFNIDRTLSRSLNDHRELSGETEIQNGTLLTDSNGIATTVLVADAEPSGTRVAVQLNAASETRTFIFRAGPDSDRDEAPSTIPPPKPLPPGSIAEFSVSDNGSLLTARWNGVSGNAGYQLRLVAGDGKPHETIIEAETDTESLSFAVPDHLPPDHYRVQILTLAEPQDLNSDWSVPSEQSVEFPPGPKTPEEMAMRLREQRLPPTTAGRQVIERFPDLSLTHFLSAMRAGEWLRRPALEAARAAFPDSTPEAVVTAVLSTWGAVVESCRPEGLILDLVDESIIAMWLPSPEASQYTLEFLDTHGNVVLERTTASTAAPTTFLSINQSQLTGGRDYRVRIRAAVTSGEHSQWSQDVRLSLPELTPEAVAMKLRERGETPAPTGVILIRRFSSLSEAQLMLAMRDGGWTRRQAAEALRAAFPHLRPHHVVEAILAAWPAELRLL